MPTGRSGPCWNKSRPAASPGLDPGRNELPRRPVEGHPEPSARCGTGSLEAADFESAAESLTANCRVSNIRDATEALMAFSLILVICLVLAAALVWWHAR